MKHIKKGDLERLEIELEKILGKKNITKRFVDRLNYSVDVFWIPEMQIDRGKTPKLPDIIVHPENKEQISKIVKLANEYKIPIVPWGGGSGSQGGALPVKKGIVVDIKKMDGLIDIDEKSMIVSIEAGILVHSLEQILNEKGFTMGHFPASAFCATLAGSLAHRGSGVLSNKYGKIEDMIISMEVVLPNGDIINTSPVPRHAAGPDLNQLFIGSEGTLGIITEATFKIHYLPEIRKFRSFLFKDLHGAFESGREIMLERLNNCTTIRIYDEVETKRYLSKVLGIKKEGVYMIFGFDGSKDVVEIEEKKAIAICEKFGGVDLGEKGGNHWWKHKYDFFFPPNAFWIPQMFGTMDTVAVYSKMENIFENLKKTIEEQFPQAYVIAHFSHWYDWGCMGYIRFIIDDPPNDPIEAQELHDNIWDVGIHKILENGGMINEHHGVGIKLARFMRDQYGSTLDLLNLIKNSLDPNGIMNPGKLGLGDKK